MNIFNLKKCGFAQPGIEYLGHIIDANGVHLPLFKIDEIVKAPSYYGPYYRPYAVGDHFWAQETTVKVPTARIQRWSLSI